MEELKKSLEQLTETTISDLKTVKICSYKDMASIITAENLLDAYYQWFLQILPRITGDDAEELLLMLERGKETACSYVRRRQELTR